MYGFRVYVKLNDGGKSQKKKKKDRQLVLKIVINKSLDTLYLRVGRVGHFSIAVIELLK